MVGLFPEIPVQCPGNENIPGKPEYCEKEIRNLCKAKQRSEVRKPKQSKGYTNQECVDVRAFTVRCTPDYEDNDTENEIKNHDRIKNECHFRYTPFFISVGMVLKTII